MVVAASHPGLLSSHPACAIVLHITLRCGKASNQPTLFVFLSFLVPKFFEEMQKNLATPPPGSSNGCSDLEFVMLVPDELRRKIGRVRTYLSESQGLLPE
ncbi:hypothetical protein EJB05_35191 [Eragrostis curvula]|uniref:Uncharacterized protein n=1 Tax=Eragrostis curvula TaxID=38414 RepID=A0A5J9U5R5_9POAL|nr:hypothetical protein EJB05_35191 [Eragrostis curvula]